MSKDEQAAVLDSEVNDFLASARQAKDSGHFVAALALLDEAENRLKSLRWLRQMKQEAA